VLDVRDIHTSYGESYILQGVSLTVGAGQVVSVLGRNGVGKTTLMRSIIGFTPPHRGHVVLNGEDITRLPTHQIVRRGIGLVPQGRRVFPSLDVQEHLLIGERRAGTSRWEIDKILDLFPRLRERLHQGAGKLSGGEQQMLACGRALVGNPRILLMDEPSEGLAPLLVRELGRILAELKARGTSILLVEQNLAFALRVADRVYLMSKGRIVHETAPDDLRRDEAAKSRWLGV
jgi:branched-chain amino acid transport system ATP-binding protein